MASPAALWNASTLHFDKLSVLSEIEGPALNEACGRDAVFSNTYERASPYFVPRPDFE